MTLLISIYTIAYGLLELRLAVRLKHHANGLQRKIAVDVRQHVVAEQQPVPYCGVCGFFRPIA
jgi:hypothetical protein